VYLIKVGEAIQRIMKLLVILLVNTLIFFAKVEFSVKRIVRSFYCLPGAKEELQKVVYNQKRYGLDGFSS